MTTRYYDITNPASGHSLGVWPAYSRDGALHAMAREAGYSTYKALQAEQSATLVLTEIDPPASER